MIHSHLSLAHKVDYLLLLYAHSPGSFVFVEEGDSERALIAPMRAACQMSAYR